jgi:2-haloacid dehalogenase
MEGMTTRWGPKPEWLTFDCYGTLIQWDEGLLSAVARLLRDGAGMSADAARFVRTFDGHEHALEQETPHLSFREVSRRALAMTMRDLRLPFEPADSDILIGGISSMPPFPEVVPALAALKRQGFKALHHLQHR